MDEMVGKILGDRYRLEKVVATGGMGTVYKATHIALKRQVAVKIMIPQLVMYKDQITRFLNEALGVASISHRNIVAIIDVGKTEDDLPYFVMEYLKGESLRTRMKLKTRIAVSEAAGIMTQALTGLSVLHHRKIVHRDMKPSNIFIVREEDGTDLVKLLDFGVSKFHILEGDKLTEFTTTGTILGTPSYMSPEQARGWKKEIDHRSDIYSCGVVLYRAVTGINPFKGENYNEAIGNILMTQAPSPSFFEKDVPVELDDVILKAMERDKARRFQTCEEFIAALEPFLKLSAPKRKPAPAARPASPSDAPVESDTSIPMKAALEAGDDRPMEAPPVQLTDAAQEQEEAPAAGTPEEFTDISAEFRDEPAEKEPSHSLTQASAEFSRSRIWSVKPSPRMRIIVLGAVSVVCLAVVILGIWGLVHLGSGRGGGGEGSGGDVPAAASGKKALGTSMPAPVPALVRISAADASSDPTDAQGEQTVAKKPVHGTATKGTTEKKQPKKKPVKKPGKKKKDSDLFTDIGE
jgi:serine/threonine protein kinase